MKISFGKKEYFEEIFTRSSFEDDPWGHNWRISQRCRYTQYLQLLRTINGKCSRILDVGCALGDFTVQVKELLQPEEICAIDISEEAIKKANIRHKNRGIKFELGSLPNLEEFRHGSFSLVLALEVLYYLRDKDRREALKEIKRVLKRRGFLLVSVNINRSPYFQIHQFYSLINEFFEIRKVQYNYGRIYSFFERKMLVLDRTIFKRFIRCLLSIEVLVSIGQLLTKLILGRKGITIMYILAEKAENQEHNKLEQICN